MLPLFSQLLRWAFENDLFSPPFPLCFLFVVIDLYPPPPSHSTVGSLLKPFPKSSFLGRSLGVSSFFQLLLGFDRICSYLLKSLQFLFSSGRYLCFFDAFFCHREMAGAASRTSSISALGCYTRFCPVPFFYRRHNTAVFFFFSVSFFPTSRSFSLCPLESLRFMELYPFPLADLRSARRNFFFFPRP